MMKMTMRLGTNITNAAANCQGSEACVSDVRMRAGSVGLRKVRTAAAKTSFQDSTQVKMAAAVRPGRASGSETFRKARAGEQPRVWAAS